MELLAINETRGFDRAQLGTGLQQRLRFLDEPDRKLLEFTLVGRLSRREAAMLLGMSCGNVSRRIRRLMQVLHEPLVVALIDDGQFMPEMHREVGLAYFLRRWPIPLIAREMEMTRYHVKRVLAYVRGWYEARREQRRELKPEI
jgi:hypothetical protein